MPKPPNIATVYPLRSELETTTIDTSGNKPLVVFNPELEDPSTVLTSSKKLDTVLKSLSGLDVEVAVLTSPGSADVINKAVENASFKNSVKVYKTENVFDVRLNAAADAKVFYLSQCTQANFLSALEKFQAPIIGYANELSHT